MPPIDHSLTPQTEEQKQHQINSARDRFNALTQSQSSDSFVQNFENSQNLKFRKMLARGPHLEKYCYRVQIANKDGRETCDKSFFFKPTEEGSEQTAHEQAVKFRDSMLAKQPNQYQIKQPRRYKPTDSFVPEFENSQYLSFKRILPSKTNPATRYSYRVQIGKTDGIEPCNKSFFFKPTEAGSERTAHENAVRFRDEKLSSIAQSFSTAHAPQ